MLELCPPRSVGKGRLRPLHRFVASCFSKKIESSYMDPYSKNMKATLSTRGRITIPKNIREQLGLCQGQQLDFEIQDALLIGRKSVVGDPVIEVKGILSHLDLDVDRTLEESRRPV